MFNPDTPSRTGESWGASGEPDPPGIPDSAPITSVTFRLRPEDVRAFRAATQPRILTAILLVVAGLTIATCILSLVLHVRRFGPSHPEAIKMAGLLAFMVIVGVGTILWQKWHKGAESPHETKVELTPEGLIVRQTGVIEVKHAWTHIAEIRERPEHFLVYLKIFNPLSGREKPMPVFLIPRRAFATPEAADVFLHTARECVAKAPFQGR
jgi:hypothetical protein